MAPSKKQPTFVYLPAESPDAARWLAASETERFEAAKRAHSHPEPFHPPMPSREGHAIAHTIVENQLAMDDPPEVKLALERLRSEGLGRHDAIHAIGSVLMHYLNDLARGMEPDLTLYTAALQALTAASWKAR